MGYGLVFLDFSPVIDETTLHENEKMCLLNLRYLKSL